MKVYNIIRCTFLALAVICWLPVIHYHLINGFMFEYRIIVVIIFSVIIIILGEYCTKKIKDIYKEI